MAGQALAAGGLLFGVQHLPSTRCNNRRVPRAQTSWSGRERGRPWLAPSGGFNACTGTPNCNTAV